MVARVVAVIREGWDAFARYLAADTPPLTDADCRQREDAAWRQAAAAFVQAKGDTDLASGKLDEARAALPVAKLHRPSCFVAAR